MVDVDGHLDTAEGRVSVQRRQVRHPGPPYRSRLYEVLRGDLEMVEQLAVEMFARALSTCDVDDALTDGNGVCLPSTSGVSEVTEALWAEYEAFQARDLSTIPVLYVLLDGLYEPLRTHGIEREAVLCAWAIALEGKKVLLLLSLGNKESYEAWLGFLRDLVSRGLPHPADGDHRRRTRPAAGRGRGVGGQSALALLGPSHAQLSSQSAPLTVVRNQGAPASHP